MIPAYLLITDRMTIRLEAELRRRGEALEKDEVLLGEKKTRKQETEISGSSKIRYIFIFLFYSLKDHVLQHYSSKSKNKLFNFFPAVLSSSVGR